MAEKNTKAETNKYAELRRTLFEIDVVTVDGETFITLTAEGVIISLVSIVLRCFAYGTYFIKQALEFAAAVPAQAAFDINRLL